MNMKRIGINIAISILAILGILASTAFAAEIHGMKWDDSNGNAIKDPGELGVQGVTVCYYSHISIPWPGICETTDASGNYAFLGLANGTYEIYEVIPVGKAQTYPFGCPVAANCTGGPGYHEVTVEDLDIETDINFGNADASEIHGTKFNDSDGDGTKDPGELGVSGIHIIIKRILSPGNEVYFGYRMTDTNGDYNFNNLSAGFYKIEETGLIGVSQTYPAAGAPYYITLGVGEVITGIDFGNQQVPPGAISGSKFNDTNGNGVQDGLEGGIAGINITLVPSGRTITTDSNGDYMFVDVPVGLHTVFEELVSGYTSTTPVYVNVQVNSGMTSFANFGNRMLVPPPADVSIPQQFGSQSGVPTVRSSIPTLTIQKDLSGVSNLLGVNLTLKWSGGITKTADMVYNSTTGLWEATFNPPFPSGTAQMIFNEDVAPPGDGPEDIIQIGDIIFIDPSGKILSACNNEPIAGAEVTLLVEFPPTTGNFIVSPPENQLEDNPQTTLADGIYGWMTVPGTYKVTVTNTGYDPNESDPVIVPPPKTDLDILLTPTGGCIDFSGFFPPVENLPVLNKAKAGSAIPLKFSLNGYQGMDIFETDYPKSSEIYCENPIDTIGADKTATAGKSGLSYDQTTDQYKYVWKTDKTWTNCRQLVMELKDGTYHRANFRFSK